MQVHLYALCWNDADMLPFFFRHYDPLVSRYFIFDDHSSDGSLDLVRAHPNVEVEPFVRSDPDSFTLSELSISNECWKRSRGSADWVIVIDIDEHLFHPDLSGLLMRYKALGITIVPALGYQMISEEVPGSDALLCEAHTCGAPWNIYSKLTLFDPSAITEIDYGVGRHHASPTGRVIAPANDELLLLHYKFLGFTRTHARHQQQRGGLRSKDLESGWGYQYRWSKEELRNAWGEFARNAIDVHTDAAVVNYPIPRSWEPFRSLATQPCTQPPDIDHPRNKEPAQKGKPVAGQTVPSDVVAAISPVSFWVPDYVCASAWIEHAPFAFWICEQLRPLRIVELGTHYGYSYFAFCQAIDRLRLGTTAYAVDTWKGDEHAGSYDESVFRSVIARNSERYAAFSCLIRSTFQDALQYFNEGSVDLLHIDGRHFYDDIERDFTLWRPKLTEDAVVLFHDTNVREREFGVWKFFEKVAAQHPSFQFFHGYGLGVLVPGDRVPAPLAPLIKASRETAHQIRAAYAALGGALTVRAALGQRHHEIEAINTEHARSLDEIEGLKALIATIVNERDEAVAALAAGREALASSRALLAETEQSTGVLQATLAERDGALAAISQRANEFFAAIQSAEAKLGKRDDDLLRAERELSGRNAAAVALQSEIITLRNALAAARDVGRAALAALRAEPAMMSGSRRNAGRLALVGRSFGFRGRDRLLLTSPGTRHGSAPVRVLFLTRYGRLGASSRQRCYLYLDALGAADIAYHVSPFLSDDYVRRLNSGRAISVATVFRAYFRRLILLLCSRSYDLLWIEKETLPWIPAWAELAMLRRGTRIFVDYDDAIFHRYDQHKSGVVRRLLGRKIDRVMAAADIVTVGNAYLASRARQAGATKIIEAPTVVDLQHYPVRLPALSRDGEPFTLGWIGSALTSAYLDWLRPVLAELANQISFRIILVGASLTALADSPVERVAWSLRNEAAQLARFDVGLMPLPDLPWERGKCGYKLIQYMASSLPVVASPVGANRAIVVPGETGFLAETHRDWVSSLTQLAQNPVLRHAMGIAGRHRAEERYSLAAASPGFVDLLYNIAAPSSRPRRPAATSHHSMSGPAPPQELAEETSMRFPPGPHSFLNLKP